MIERPDRELVVGDRDELWLKAGRAAGADDHAVGQSDGPVVVAQVARDEPIDCGQRAGGRARSATMNSLVQQVVAA